MALWAWRVAAASADRSSGRRPRWAFSDRACVRAAKRGGVARGRCDVADRQRGNSQRRTDLTGQTVGGSFADTPPVGSTGALVGRALREPGRAVTYGLALAKGYWYRVILRILGRRF